MYTTYFWLRAKNAAGTVQTTFKPHAALGRKVSVQRGEGVYIEREGIAYDDASYFLGYKQRVDAEFTCAESAVVACDPATAGTPAVALYVSLEVCLNSLPAGGTMEYCIDSAGTTWVPCIVEDATPDKPADNNSAIRVSLSCISRAIVASPFRAS